MPPLEARGNFPSARENPQIQDQHPVELKKRTRKGPETNGAALWVFTRTDVRASAFPRAGLCFAFPMSETRRGIRRSSGAKQRGRPRAWEDFRAEGG